MKFINTLSRGAAAIATTAAAIATIITPAAVSAHAGNGPVTGFVSGILHILSGADHLLGIFGIGLGITVLIAGFVYWRQ